MDVRQVRRLAHPVGEWAGSQGFRCSWDRCCRGVRQRIARTTCIRTYKSSPQGSLAADLHRSIHSLVGGRGVPRAEFNTGSGRVRVTSRPCWQVFLVRTRATPWPVRTGSACPGCATLLGGFGRRQAGWSWATVPASLGLLATGDVDAQREHVVQSIASLCRDFRCSNTDRGSHNG